MTIKKPIINQIIKYLGFAGIITIYIMQLYGPVRKIVSQQTFVITLTITAVFIFYSLYLKIKKEIDNKTFTIKNYSMAIAFIVLTILMFIYELYFTN